MSIVKISFAVALAVMGAELAIRWGIRLSIDPGSTVPIFGKFYLVNAKNVNTIRALGLTSEGWLMVAMVTCLLMVAAYFYLLHHPALRGNRLVAIGCISSFVLSAVVAANLIEAMLLGGVTDYLAIVDIASGRAKVINLGDVFLFVALVTLILSAIGVAASAGASDGKAVT